MGPSRNGKPTRPTPVELGLYSNWWVRAHKDKTLEAAIRQVLAAHRIRLLANHNGMSRYDISRELELSSEHVDRVFGLAFLRKIGLAISGRSKARFITDAQTLALSQVCKIDLDKFWPQKTEWLAEATYRLCNRGLFDSTGKIVDKQRERASLVAARAYVLYRGAVREPFVPEVRRISAPAVVDLDQDAINFAAAAISEELRSLNKNGPVAGEYVLSVSRALGSLLLEMGFRFDALNKLSKR